jgi:hypothetical protein
MAVLAGAETTALGPATFILGLMSKGAVGGSLTMSSILPSAAIEAAALGSVAGMSGVCLTGGVTGTYEGAPSGLADITIPTGDAELSLFNRVIDKFDAPTASASGVRAVSEGLYGTSCALA